MPYPVNIRENEKPFQTLFKVTLFQAAPVPDQLNYGGTTKV